MCLTRYCLDIVYERQYGFGFHGLSINGERDEVKNKGKKKRYFSRRPLHFRFISRCKAAFDAAFVRWHWQANSVLIGKVRKLHSED